MPLGIRLRLWLPVWLAFFAVCATGNAELPAWHVTDLQGKQIQTLATPGTHIVVLVFAATDCPISNRYIPEIARLEETWKAKEVAFWWVYPNPADTLSIVHKHSQDYSVSAPALIDTNQDLVRMSHATVTPEAAVFSVDKGELREVYHGRIDNRYVAFGAERPQATRHDLENAIEAALAHKPMPAPDAGPVGCSIVPVAAK